MTRTQILLESWQHRFLAGLARKSGMSVSGLIRAWVDEKASAAGGKGREDALYRMVGSVQDEASDVSEDVDAYLYGAKSRRRR